MPQETRVVGVDVAKLKVDDHIDELGTTVGETLITPTRIYARAVRGLLASYRVKSVVHGLAHITGGGLHENLARILPAGARALIERGSWKVPPVFPWLARLGEVEPEEMDRVFNMGIGLVLIVSPYYAASIRQKLADDGLENFDLGRIEAGEKGVAWA